MMEFVSYVTVVVTCLVIIGGVQETYCTGLGQNCHSDPSGCGSEVPNSECTSLGAASSCGCKAGFVQAGSACVTPDQVKPPPGPGKPTSGPGGPTLQTFGGSCTSNDNCMTQGGLKCVNKKCACNAGLDWIDSRCRKPVSDKKCTPGAIPDDCTAEAVRNMECNNTTLKCQCPPHMSFSVEDDACKLKAGENCVIKVDNGTDVYEHDNCASHHCQDQKTDPDTFQKCECKDVNNMKQIWSSEPGENCVPNFYDAECKDTRECLWPTFNTTRKGLVCQKNGRCACEKGLTFSHGFCVVAKALYNEMCDPRGLDVTCKTDNLTMLSCKDIGKGSYRCVCLLKEITRGKGKRTITLFWNHDSKICDLKPNGERCNGAYECRSGYCREKCMTYAPGKAKGHLTTASLFTICLTLLNMF